MDSELRVFLICKELAKNHPTLVGKMRDGLDSGLQEAFNAQREDAIRWELIANTALTLIKKERVSPQHKQWAEGLFEQKIKQNSSFNPSTFKKKQIEIASAPNKID